MLSHSVSQQGIELMDEKFCIIANNCWGAEVYKYKQLPFNTPFIGLFLYPECYLKLLGNFEKNVKSDLRFTTRSKHLATTPAYPVGLLEDDIEIHFLHYKTVDEAREKWNKRLNRIPANDDNLFFKFDDRDGCTSSQLETFHQLPFRNKISFSIASHPHLTSNVRVIRAKGQTMVHDGLALFAVSIKYFDLNAWLNREGVKTTFTNLVAKNYYELRKLLGLPLI